MDAAVAAGTQEVRPLFSQLLGEDFAALPEVVRRLHLRAGPARYLGEVDVRRGHGLLSRLCAAATRLPPAGSGAIAVDIDIRPNAERWIRHVRGHAMASRLWSEDGLLCEQLGLVRFGFRLRVRDGGIEWAVERVRALGFIPLPARWFSGVHAREAAQGERYAFDVLAALPVLGLLVHYRGWLDVA